MQSSIKCPTCKKATMWKDNPHRPFCSERCRQIDLGNWADETYRVPGRTLSEENMEKVIDIKSRKNNDLEGDN